MNSVNSDASGASDTQPRPPSENILYLDMPYEQNLEYCPPKTHNGLQKLIAKGESGKLVKALPDKKKKINFCATKNGLTPLYLAAALDREECVKALLYNDVEAARPNMKSYRGRTPLCVVRLMTLNTRRHCWDI